MNTKQHLTNLKRGRKGKKQEKWTEETNRDNKTDGRFKINLNNNYTKY